MYVLYYFPDNASLTPHMVLREIGVPFELRLVDRKNNAQKSVEYLKLNPNGLIPVLVADGQPSRWSGVWLILAGSKKQKRL
jgi:glutathione S-transferase